MFARGIAAPCDRRASGSSTGGTKRRGPDRLSRRWWRFSRPGQRDGAARRDSTGHPRGFQSVGRATSAALGASETQALRRAVVHPDHFTRAARSAATIAARIHSTRPTPSRSAASSSRPSNRGVSLIVTGRVAFSVVVFGMHQEWHKWSSPVRLLDSAGWHSSWRVSPGAGAAGADRLRTCTRART